MKCSLEKEVSNKRVDLLDTCTWIVRENNKLSLLTGSVSNSHGTTSSLTGVLVNVLFSKFLVKDLRAEKCIRSI